MKKTIVLALCLSTICGIALAQAPGDRAEVKLSTPGARWSLAIHGGAGVIPKTMPEGEKAEYFKALEDALGVGK